MTTEPVGRRGQVTAFVGRNRVGAGTAKTTGGRAKVRVTFTRKARRSLARKRTVKLRLKVSFKPAGATPVQSTTAVTLRR